MELGCETLGLAFESVVFKRAVKDVVRLKSDLNVVDDIKNRDLNAKRVVKTAFFVVKYI